MTPLHFSADEGFSNLARFFLEKGLYVDTKANYKHYVSVTPLWIAAFKGHNDVLDVLISKGASVDEKEKLYGSTPLYIACGLGFLDIANLLISKGADVNIKTVDNITPLHIAAYSGNEKIVELLLKRGAYVNVIGGQGKSLADVYGIPLCMLLELFPKAQIPQRQSKGKKLQNI